MRVLRLLVAVLAVLTLATSAPTDEEPTPALAGPERAAALEQAEVLDREMLGAHKKRRYDLAIPAAEQAVTLRESALGAAHPEVAASLHNLGEMLRAAWRYAEAIPVYQRAIAIREQAFGPDHIDVAMSVNAYGSLLSSLARYEEALALYERALAIREEELGPNAHLVAVVLRNIASVHVYTGRFEQARPPYDRALAIWEEAYGPEHKHVATCLHGMGELYRLSGHRKQARLLFERALRIREARFGGEHPAVAQTLQNLAHVLQEIGDLEAAAPLYERALRIGERTLGPGCHLVGTILAGLGNLHATAGRLERAVPLLERSLAIRTKLLGSEHSSIAVGLNNLAGIYADTGRLEQALSLQERAVSTWARVLGPGHADVARGLHNLAMTLFEAGRHEQALEASARCLAIIEPAIRARLAGFHGSERLALASGARIYLDGWLRAAARLGRSGYGEVLRFKGLVARATHAERLLVRRGGAKATTRTQALQVAVTRLSALANAMPPMFDRQKREAWQEAYAAAAARRASLAEALARDFAPLRAGLERLHLGRADVQRALQPNEVLMDLLRTNDRYVAWVVRSTGAVVPLDLGEAEPIEAAAIAFAEECAASNDDEGWQRTGRTLGNLILEPLAEHLGPHVRTLFLSPDAALAAVPFAALPVPGKDHPLIDAVRLVTVAAAQDLVPWDVVPGAGRGTLLLGGIDYDGALPEDASPDAAPPASATPAHRAPRGGSFPYLPFTGEEVNGLRLRLGDDALALVGRRATEARMRALAPGRRRLHLATHGFVRTDLLRGLARVGREVAWLGADIERQLAQGHDPMVLAGLAMAGANLRDGGNGDDGILTAAEVSCLDLDGVDLVVLSACETALGTAESGEGVLGLVRGFQMAGARRVIGSLWQVDDEATRLLMERIYAGMLREDDPLAPAEALRRAALHLRGATSPEGRSFAHPRYWAAFVAYGR